MTKQIVMDIEDCKECPHREYDESYGSYSIICTQTARVLYVFNSEKPFEGIIPKDCPLADKES